MVDFIARYDNWHDDTKVIFDKVGLKIEDMEGKRWRQTKRDKDYKKYYTNDKMIDEVAQHFRSDIAMFGDQF